MRFIIVVLVLWLAGCTAKDTPPTNKYVLIDGTNVTVTIEKHEGERWQAHYVFATPQTAAIFSRSHNDYRTKSWKALNKGTKFERIAGFDAAIFETPVTKADFEFEPFSGKVRREYTPFIPFSDGSVAVYTGQFELLAVKDRAAIEALQGNLQNWNGEQGKLAVRVLSKDVMIKSGEIVRDEVINISAGGGEYIYVGSAKITKGKDFIGVIDPGLPEWLRTRLDGDLSQIFDGLRELWGDSLPQKSTVLFSFRGYDSQGFSNKGGALNGMLALEVSGVALHTENKSTLKRIHWFFAHEAAHLFQTRHNTELGNSEDAWISEGGANAMANILLRRQGLADDNYVLGEYRREYTQCRDYLKIDKLSHSMQKGRFDIHYACGDIMALITNGALANHNLFDFWNLLIVDTKEKNAYSADNYFNIMDSLGAPAHITKGLKKIANERIDNPHALLKNLMEESGLSPEFDTSGELISLTLP